MQNYTKEEIFQDLGILKAPTTDILACRKLLMKLLTLINRGTELTEDEGVNVFFGITRLFMETNQSLKKVIYLTIREMVTHSSFYMITSSLLKDVKDKNDFNKIDALKVIPYIISQNNSVQSEQMLKNVLYDKNNLVANAAIMASSKISLHEPEHVKKCVNDIQELLTSKPDI